MSNEGVVFDAEVSIAIKGFAWNGKLSDVVRINLNNIDAEMARQPELVSYFGVVAVEAVDRVEALKNELASLKEDEEMIYANLDLLARDGSLTPDSAKKDKKPTEKELESLVKTHARYREVVDKIRAKREEIRDANLLLAKVNKILIALEHKRDMMIQLSANQRKELTAGDYTEQQH